MCSLSLYYIYLQFLCNIKVFIVCRLFIELTLLPLILNTVFLFKESFLYKFFKCIYVVSLQSLFCVSFFSRNVISLQTLEEKYKITWR